MKQKHKKKVSYITRGLLSALLLPGGIMQLILHEAVVNNVHHLQIDNMTMIRVVGVFKILGAVGLWVPKGRAWAVHGTTFLLIGALSAHIGVGDPLKDMFGAVLGLFLLGASEWFSVDTKRTSGVSTTNNNLANTTRSKRSKRAA